MTLNVLKPTPITLDAQLLSNSATDSTDPVFTAWASGSQTFTALTSFVKYNHRRYKCVQTFTRTSAGTDHLPDEVDSAWWLDIGPTNWWACIDTRTSTKTYATGSLVVALKPNACINSIAVLGVTGAASVQVDVYKGSGRTTGTGHTVGGDLIYTKTQGMDNTFISGWYQWLFEPYEAITNLLFGALESPTLAGGVPPYYTAEVVVTITGTSGGATVGCGGISLGTAVEIGAVFYGAGATIEDYTVINKDGSGEYEIIERGYEDNNTYQVSVLKSQIRRVHSTLTALRATPCVWVGSTDYDYSPLVVFGIPGQFALTGPRQADGIYNLEIKGLT